MQTGKIFDIFSFDPIWLVLSPFPLQPRARKIPVGFRRICRQIHDFRDLDKRELQKQSHLRDFNLARMRCPEMVQQIVDDHCLFRFPVGHRIFFEFGDSLPLTSVSNR